MSHISSSLSGHTNQGWQSRPVNYSLRATGITVISDKKPSKLSKARCRSRTFFSVLQTVPGVDEAPPSVFEGIADVNFQFFFHVSLSDGAVMGQMQAIFRAMAAFF